jgi:4-oxalomesaconate tautomerase
VAATVARPVNGAARRVEVEHPSGFFTVDVDVQLGERIVVRSAALLRTARKLMRGHVFVPGTVWSRA